MNKKQETEKHKIEAILEGIRRLKGNEIKKIDLTTIDHSECNYFIICHGTSNTHADAIAQSVEETVKEQIGEQVWHKDGYRNAIWILLDYGDIMVHVFQENARKFYNLESLWADAEVINIEETS